MNKRLMSGRLTAGACLLAAMAVFAVNKAERGSANPPEVRILGDREMATIFGDAETKFCKGDQWCNRGIANSDGTCTTCGDPNQPLNPIRRYVCCTNSDFNNCDATGGL